VRRDAGGGASHATYDPDASNPTRLHFLYVVGHGDSLDGTDLAYACDDGSGGCAIEAGPDGASILRRSACPTTPANLTLPLPPVIVSTDPNGPIIIQTDEVPRVTGVHLTNSSGVFAPGDTIGVSIRFDKALAVVGDPPALRLDVEGGRRRARGVRRALVG